MRIKNNFLTPLLHSWPSYLLPLKRHRGKRACGQFITPCFCHSFLVLSTCSSMGSFPWDSPSETGPFPRGAASPSGMDCSSNVSFPWGAASPSGMDCSNDGCFPRGAASPSKPQGPQLLMEKPAPVCAPCGLQQPPIAKALPCKPNATVLIDMLWSLWTGGKNPETMYIYVLYICSTVFIVCSL